MALGLLLLMLLIEGSFRLSGAHRFVHWLDYGYGTEQGLRKLADGSYAQYSSANRRFWPRHLGATPPAGAQRIVVVGDSVARGGSPENNWPRQAELALNRAGCRAEVINLSSGGYGSARKLDVARMAMDKLQPHWIVYQASITTEYEDRLDAGRREQARREPWQIENHSWAALWLKERKFDILYSRWLSPAIRKHSQSAGDQEALAAKTDLSAWYPTTLTNSRLLVELARQRGVGLVMAPRMNYRLESGAIDGFGMVEMSVHLVGPQRVFDWSLASGHPPHAQMFADGTHFKPIGNQWVGEQMARWWLKAGLCR